MKTWLFWIGAGIDIIGLGIIIFIMLDDQLKGRTASNNPTLFGITLLATALVVGAFILKHFGKTGLANALLWIPATPLGLYGLFILLFIILKPDMK
ncbi:MAG: hypothetical protein K9J37_23645 [Saprospiraceae bacterium]|nr:hypothetical protein [Saprospiraceae bacterium]MCF8252921.1 hypothetical protein [Saprospiraceae bacterium]MCF8281584.1 hypothetical protein [Bacteroidales bacterium]MCF8314463.1 hypothetical protein [Saprospiraceae bacterium]MCF8443348.1 hypothetical protein [Saprospiraceae bacterium]